MKIKNKKNNVCQNNYIYNLFFITINILYLSNLNYVIFLKFTFKTSFQMLSNIFYYLFECDI